MIESPDGKTSMGVCKLCGSAREFVNSYESKEFNDTGKRRKPQLVTYAQRMWKIKNYGFDTNSHKTYPKRN
jgi:hypothetical protein